MWSRSFFVLCGRWHLVRHSRIRSKGFDAASPPHSGSRPQSQLEQARAHLRSTGSRPTGWGATHFSASAELSANEDGSRVSSGCCFKFLGAVIRDARFCTKVALDKVAKANANLDRIAQLEDPQVALKLQRHCANYSRLLHLMRPTPPEQISEPWGPSTRRRETQPTRYWAWP